MELIYFWTTSTNPSTIKKPQGFNLGSEYDFDVKCDGDKYSLFVNNNWRSHSSVYKKGCIENVSILVGENGSGKSTFLKTILQIAEELHDEYGNGLKDYGCSPFPNKEYKDLGKPHMYILVFKEKDTVHVFTSLPKLNTKCLQNIKPELHKIGGKKKTELYEGNEYPLRDTTVIYLTNSPYATTLRDVTYYKEIHTLSITPKTIESICDKFFESLYDVAEAYTNKRQYDAYLTWNWLTYRYDKREDETRDFQALIDLRYYHSLIIQDKLSDYEGKIPVAFGLYPQNIVHVFKKFIGKSGELSVLETANIRVILLCMVEALRSWESFLPKNDLLVRILYFNLTFETVLRCGSGSGVRDGIRTVEEKNSADDLLFRAFKYAIHKFSGGHYTIRKINDSNELAGWTVDYFENEKELIAFPDTYKSCFWPFIDGVDDTETIEKWIIDKSRNTSEITNYFTAAVKEIKEFTNITKEHRKKLAPQWETVFNSDDEDMGDNRGSLLRTPFDDITDMNFYLSFHYDMSNITESEPLEERKLQQELYKNVISFIADSSKREHSFIMKYLKFKTLGMSTGERGLQNLYSWLNEIPMLVEKMNLRKAGKQDYKLKEDILLLLDEPDIYMHPQWQKNLIKNLIEELNHQYSTKSVQVIMTTSSPITLSDVPVENTVYIRYDRKNDGRTVLPHSSGYDNQTFGADIYRLYANAFFLSGSPMGAYAEDYINQEILTPLKEIREEIEKYERGISGGETDKEPPDIGNILARIGYLKGMVDILGCNPLRRKVISMCEDIEEWCKNDTNNRKT